jgi:hypothetical protein
MTSRWRRMRPGAILGLMRPSGTVTLRSFGASWCERSGPAAKSKIRCRRSFCASIGIGRSCAIMRRYGASCSALPSRVAASGSAHAASGAGCVSRERSVLDDRSASHRPRCPRGRQTTYAILDRLDANSRLAFVLTSVDGWELTEVAEAFSVSLATVKRRLSRIRCESSRARRRTTYWYIILEVGVPNAKGQGH